MIENKNTIPNIWTAQQNLLHFYRVLTAGLGLLAVLMLIFIGVIYFRDPIVVVKAAARQEFYPSVRGQVKVDKSDVEDFTKQFLAALYVWSEFNESTLAKEISTYAEDGLISKVIGAQSAKYGKLLKDKKIEQSIAFVKVKVLEDRVQANFLRVLLIEGIPLTVPTEITISMIQGTPTRQNPVGIYISGIIEHEGAK
jgi:hypothetical protein